MYQAILHWRVYLQGTKFLVKTDCKSLLNLDTIFRNGDAALRRKVQVLVGQFMFSIQHVSGDSNKISDFLSRAPFKKRYINTGTGYIV